MGLLSLFGLGAKTGAAPVITSTGGQVIQGALGAAPRFAGVANPVGGALSAYGGYELLNAILGGLGNVGRETVKAVGQGTQSPVPQAVNMGNKYTLPMESPLAYQQNYQREMYNRALLQTAGLDPGLLGPLPARPLTQQEAFNLNQLAMQRAGEREQLLARIQGELAAAPAAFNAQSAIGQSTGGALQSAINTVLQRDPLEANQALAAIARTNQFSN